MTKTHRDSIMHRVAALLAAVAVVLAPVAVRAQPTDTVAEARQHFQSGKQLFDAGDYRGAIREFEAANKLAPAPLLLFNIGLAYERLGEAAPALQYFKAYLEQAPNASNRSLVEIKIDRLQGGHGQGAAGQPGTGTQSGTPGIPAPVPGQPAPTTVPGATTGTAVTPQPGFQPGTQPGTPPAPAASTGDPMLDRVSAVDVSWVRDQRAPLMTAAASVAEAAPAPRSKPAHKQVWFWVVVGVSALILIDIMSGSDTGAQPSDAAASPALNGSGATLLRF
jgi:hypothetical protein